MGMRFMSCFRFALYLALPTLLFLSGCGTFHSAGPFGGEKVVIRTTAYTHTEADHRRYGRSNAVGTTLSNGEVKSAAADWSKYPLGTKFRLSCTEEIFQIDDYGSALVGTDTIDLYKINQREMRKWGVREVEIEILEWGCYAESHSVLAPRQRHAHVRRMVQSLTPKLDESASADSASSEES